MGNMSFSIEELIALFVALGATIILLSKIGILNKLSPNKAEVSLCDDHGSMIENLRAMEKILDKQIMIGKMHDRRISSLEEKNDKIEERDREIRDRLISIEKGLE
jgi:hypothetical protein